MSKLEEERFEKQVYENQETAIKLLNKVVELQKIIDEQENKIEQLKDDVEHWKDEYNRLQRDLEENYVEKPFDPYSEYGISERDFH